MSLAASTVASVVAELEAYMASGPMGGSPAVKHILGGRQGAAAQMTEAVVWVPKKRRSVEPRRAEPDGDTIKNKRTTCEVTCYASDFARLEQIVDGLEAALDDVLSVSAYELPDEGDYYEPSANASSCSFVRHVVLIAPVFSGLYQQGHVATVTGSVGTTDALGDQGAETGASFVAGA